MGNQTKWLEIYNSSFFHTEVIAIYSMFYAIFGIFFIHNDILVSLFIWTSNFWIWFAVQESFRHFSFMQEMRKSESLKYGFFFIIIRSVTSWKTSICDEVFMMKWVKWNINFNVHLGCWCECVSLWVGFKGKRKLNKLARNEGALCGSLLSWIKPTSELYIKVGSVMALNLKRNLWMKIAKPAYRIFIQSFQDLLSEMDMIFEQSAFQTKRRRKSYWFHAF